jgi:DNA-directed RNA polymerase specialized sigma24 family protein
MSFVSVLQQMSSPPATTSLDATQAGFDKTHWSIVLPAAGQDSAEAQQALESLCKTYWPPLYAFLRKQGRSPEDSKDLTQGFFVHLLARNRLQQVAPAKGKFRSFLLACLNNYVHNERDKERADKRGGGQALVAIDTSETETRFGVEPADNEDPAKAFERNWASTLIRHVLEGLKLQYSANGKSALFDALHPFLTGDAERGGYAHPAARLRMSEGAVRVAATRLRNDFRELLRTEVARTVDSPAEIDEEIRHLFRALSGA